MLKYTSVFYDLMMRSWPYTCVDQWPGFVQSVRKYTSVHSRTPPYIYTYIYIGLGSNVNKIPKVSCVN
ncbi:hypothetical protein Hanom_Chr00s000006g01613951 [Helianthus anomalus]